MVGEISNNCPNDVFGINVCKTCESCWFVLLLRLQWTSTTSVISKFEIYLPFLSFVILFPLLPNNFIVSGNKISW